MGLPLVGQKAMGFRTMFGSWIAPGANVTYLGPAGVFEATFTENNRVATLNAAAARCRSGKGDVIFALPGYSESISAADFATSLVAGTRLISLGRPGASNNPTLTWTATASTLLLDVADVELAGFNLNFAGIDAVVAPITISAAGCVLRDNHITVAAGAAGATTPITVALGADNCLIEGNKMLQTGTQTEVNIISITGAVDNLEIVGNKISCLLTSATGGVIQVGAAATNLDIHHNLFLNSVEDGVAIRVADTFAASGWVYKNYGKGIDAGGTVANALKLISFEGTTESLIGCFENYFTDESVASGALSPAVATT
jgi:hypothetical protein